MTQQSFKDAEKARTAADSAPDGHRELNVALLGTGMIGKSHAMALRNATALYESVPLRPRLAVVFDQTEESARRGAEVLGFESWSTDWREAIADPSIDLVDIVTPNFLHKEMALAAIEAGKHVYCEKPLAPTAADAQEMTLAAEEAGVTTLAGFNFLRNPAVAFARELVEAGEIGEVYNFHGTLALDATDPNVPFTWRYDRRLAGAGALGDLGAHVIEFARALVGGIERVCGLSRVVVSERPEVGGPMGYGSRAPADAPRRAVENDDITLFVAEFASGAVGTFECNRAATGRAHDMSFTVTGSKGALRFDQQGAHALQVFLAEGPKNKRGFRSVNMGPEHGDYGRFWPFPGLNVGIHELKVIEVNELLTAIAEGRPARPDFREAWEVCRVIDAVERSAHEKRWVDLGEV